MRWNVLKWLTGTLAFFLPSAIAAIGNRLDRSAFRHDPTYVALVPVVCVGSMLLAITVPTILIVRSRMLMVYRIVLSVVYWCLLAIEFYWIFFAIVVRP